MDTQTDHSPQADNFKNRRKIAWLGAGMLVLLTGTMCGDVLWSDGTPAEWTGIATMVIGCWTTVVLGYFTSATVEKIKERVSELEPGA